MSPTNYAGCSKISSQHPHLHTHTHLHLHPYPHRHRHTHPHAQPMCCAVSSDTFSRHLDSYIHPNHPLGHSPKHQCKVDARVGQETEQIVGGPNFLSRVSSPQRARRLPALGDCEPRDRPRSTCFKRSFRSVLLISLLPFLVTAIVLSLLVCNDRLFRLGCCSHS